MEDQKELQLTQENKLKKGSAFSDIDVFKDAQRMANALCQSSLVPAAYQNNVPNTMVAMEMAKRMTISPLMVMQNLDIIQGKPSWRSSFIISALNSCGRFTPLRFEKSGADQDYGYHAYARDKETNEVINGPKVDWKMVHAEGWLNKKGSKWKTMPELMFQYRAAAFFGRLYAPDILTGMNSSQEILDISSSNSTEAMNNGKLEELKTFYSEHDFQLSEEDRMHIEQIIETKDYLSYDKALKALKANKI